MIPEMETALSGEKFIKGSMSVKDVKGDMIILRPWII